MKYSRGVWHYPDHGLMMRECRLKSISHYIRKRRGTLRPYFQRYRADILKMMEIIGPPVWDDHKLLWWKQPWIKKEAKEIRGTQKSPGKTIISPQRQEIRNLKNLKNRN